jgi:5'-3' exonuclease
MMQLADWLKEWAAGKVTSDVCYRHVTFIISDAFEPGEGEHKVRLNDVEDQNKGPVMLDTCAEPTGRPSSC